jgi:hypothetical protein
MGCSSRPDFRSADPVKSPNTVSEGLEINLRDPALAAFLAWLVPGLGHFYQRRTAKGVLFFVCILSTFVYGVYLGGSSELGWGRVVYASWRPTDRRFAYFGQVGAGLVALPALVQASRVRAGHEPLFGGFMAPPVLEREALRDPLDQHPPFTRDTLHKRLHLFFELGTVYTLIAGLLNVLAIYDAWGGPVFAEKKEEDDEEKTGDKDTSRDGESN